MKKLSVILFVLILSYALVACGNADKNNGEETKIQQTVSRQVMRLPTMSLKKR